MRYNRRGKRRHAMGGGGYTQALTLADPFFGISSSSRVYFFVNQTGVQQRRETFSFSLSPLPSHFSNYASVSVEPQSTDSCIFDETRLALDKESTAACFSAQDVIPRSGYLKSDFQSGGAIYTPGSVDSAITSCNLRPRE